MVDTCVHITYAQTCCRKDTIAVMCGLRRGKRGVAAVLLYPHPPTRGVVLADLYAPTHRINFVSSPWRPPYAHDTHVLILDLEWHSALHMFFFEILHILWLIVSLCRAAFSSSLVGYVARRRSSFLMFNWFLWFSIRFCETVWVQLYCTVTFSRAKFPPK